MKTIEKISRLNEKVGELKDEKVNYMNNKFADWVENTSNASKISVEIRDFYMELGNKDNNYLPENYILYENGIEELIYNLEGEKITNMQIIDLFYKRIDDVEAAIKVSLERELNELSKERSF